ncbi:MAG: helix-turn-helix transcriptional regulator [Methylomonas sp.]|nr:helix-turn-helix transcriptional regulator [Methylomonas sp.]
MSFTASMSTLRKRLDAINVSYAELADTAGVTPQAVTNWVKRDTMGRTSAERICSRYGLSMDWLLRDKGPMRARVGSDEGAARPATADELAGRTPLELVKAIQSAAEALARVLAKR